MLLSKYSGEICCHAGRIRNVLGFVSESIEPSEQHFPNSSFSDSVWFNTLLQPKCWRKWFESI